VLVGVAPGESKRREVGAARYTEIDWSCVCVAEVKSESLSGKKLSFLEQGVKCLNYKMGRHVRLGMYLGHKH